MARALVTKAELDQSYTYQARRSLAAGGSEPQGQSIETHVTGAILHSPKENRQLNCFIERGMLAVEVVPIAQPNTNAATPRQLKNFTGHNYFSGLYACVRRHAAVWPHKSSEDRKL